MNPVCIHLLGSNYNYAEVYSACSFQDTDSLSKDFLLTPRL